MSTRDLRVRFVGDASSLKQTFNEVGSSAQVAGTGLKSADSSAETVGRSLTRTGRVAKATGRVLKSSGADAALAGTAFASMIPGLSGVSGGLGQAVVAGDALSSTFRAIGPSMPVIAGGLAAIGVAALGGAVAYALLHDDVSAATDALRAQQKLNAEIAASHRATGEAVDTQKQSMHSLRGATISQGEAVIGLAQANKRVIETLKASGKGSLEHRQALLAQQRAQEAVITSGEDMIRQGREAIDQTNASSKAIDDEVATTHKAADAARGRALQVRLGLISGKDAVGVSRELKTTLAAEARAVATSADKHKDNAQTARQMAAAIRSNTPAAQALKARLLELARQELNLSQQIGALNSLAASARSAGLAADAASNSLVRLLNVPTRSRPGPGAPFLPGKRAKETTGGGKFSDEINARGAPRGTRLGGRGTPLTASAAADAMIADRHRDDSLQDKQTRAGVDVGGATNPDKIAAIGDKAVAQSRRTEITADAENVKTAIKRVNDRIKKKRGEVATQRAKRRAAKPKAQSAITEKIRALLDQIRDLFDERRALNADAAELKAEGAELDFDIAGLTAAISSLPDSVAADPGSVSSPDTGGADAGISADAQAQIAQAETRAATATRGAALSDALSRTLFNSGTIDPGAGFVTVNINTLHPGDPAIQGEVAAWVVGALGGQGSVPTSAFGAGV